MQPLTLAMQHFNEKVRQMNQSSGKQVILPAKDARNLQADIYTLLATVAELSNKQSAPTEDVVLINMDGGTFKA